MGAAASTRSGSRIAGDDDRGSMSTSKRYQVVITPITRMGCNVVGVRHQFHGRGESVDEELGNRALEFQRRSRGRFSSGLPESPPTTWDTPTPSKASCSSPCVDESGVTVPCGSPPTRIRWHRQRLSRRHAHLRPRRRRTARTLSYRQFDGPRSRRARAGVRWRASAIAGTGIAGEELSCGLSGHAEGRRRSVPTWPRRLGARCNPVSTQPLDLGLTTSQFTQRVEGSGRQRMRDDQVHRTSVTRRACPPP